MRKKTVDDEFLNADEEDFETDDYEEVDEEEEEDGEEAEAEADEQPPVPADHVVHVYEHGKLKRTIEREFTAEDAEEFASDYNRTARPYGRFALGAKAKSRPKKTVPWPTLHPSNK